MQRLLLDITKFARHSKEGKVQFTEFVREWSKINLDNYIMNIEKSRFVLDVKSLCIVFLSIINLAIVLFVIQYLSLNEWVTGILLFVLTFGVQLRLIFLLLSFILPSSNIILSKEAQANKNEIIICAHYDTKNSIVTRKKGKIRGFLKYNIYSFSRILTQYALLGNKTALPVSVFIYMLWFVSQSSIATVSFDGATSNFISFAISITTFLIIYGIFCTLLMIVFTLPFPKKVVNPGSDDNGSGVVGALEIAKCLNNSNMNVDIKIILFDNEERGLVGSSHYVINNLKKLKNKNSLVINLDCIGRGSDIFVLCDKLKNNKIYKMVEEAMILKKINVRCSDIDFSDHKPFLSKGVNAISIGRYNLKKYLWEKEFPVIDWIHGNEDTHESLDIVKIKEVVDVVCLALNPSDAPYSSVLPQGVAK